MADRWYANPAIRKECLVVLLLLAGHVWLGSRFADGSLFLTPDGADYLIGARSLATGHGYIDLSNPSPQPPQIFRPIGMPLILSPVVAKFGYNVRYCEFEMLGFSAATCLLAYILVRRHASMSYSCIVLLLLIISPVTLIHGSEVFSEIPFTFFVLAIACLLTQPPSKELSEFTASEEHRDSASIGMARLIIVLALAIAAEKTRALGLTIWPALCVWALFQQRRWRLLGIISIAAAASIGGEWSLRQSGGTATYVTFLRELYQREGWQGILSSIAGGARLYLGSFPAAIVPNMWPGLEFFEIGWSGRAPEFLVIAAGCVVLVIAAIGAFAAPRQNERSKVWLFVIPYFLLTFLLLLLWPRMSRLLYPLMFFVTIFFWIAIADFRNRVRGVLLGVALLAHGHGLYALVTQSVAPTGKWASISAAGDYLAHNTDPHESILTTSKDVFLFSGRFQISILGHSASQDELNRFIIQSGCKYLVITDAEDDPRLLANPAFEFEPIFRFNGEAVVWSIEPNRAGIVKPIDQIASPGNVIESAGAVREQAASLSFAEGLQRAKEWRRAGKSAAAEVMLEFLLENHRRKDAGATEAWIELANAQLMLEKPRDALSSLQQASQSSYADLYIANIRTGQEIAKVMIQLLEKGSSLAEQAASLDHIAVAAANSGRWNDAVAKSRRAMSLDPNSPDRKLFYARLLLILDRRRDCLAIVESLLTGIMPDDPNVDPKIRKSAGSIKLLLLAPQILAEGKSVNVSIGDQQVPVDPNDPTTHLEVASLCRHIGLYGKALQLLEAAAAKFPRDANILVSLATSYASFGEWEKALTTFQQAYAVEPSDGNARSVLHVEETLARRVIR